MSCPTSRRSPDCFLATNRSQSVEGNRTNSCLLCSRHVVFIQTKNFSAATNCSSDTFGLALLVGCSPFRMLGSMASMFLITKPNSLSQKLNTSYKNTGRRSSWWNKMLITSRTSSKEEHEGTMSAIKWSPLSRNIPHCRFLRVTCWPTLKAWLLKCWMNSLAMLSES